MTRKHATTTALATLAVGLTLGLAACGGGSPSSGHGGMGHASPTSSAPSAGGGAGSSNPDGVDEADVTFVQGMLPHHQQAVTMSDTLLAKDGISTGTTALAGQVKAAQQPEIDTMKGWLTAWGKPADGEMGGMGGMDHGTGDGMASGPELTQLDQAQGPEAEKLYLTLMTRHHQGAIAMAETEIRDGKDPGAVELARSIVSSQQAEIATMATLLAEL